MERNSVIAERLEKAMGDRLPRTNRYDRLFGEMSKLDGEFTKLIAGDEQLVKKYLALESVTNENQQEYESMCFCEGVRLGFKLCMDIFEL